MRRVNVAPQRRPWLTELATQDGRAPKRDKADDIVTANGLATRRRFRRVGHRFRPISGVSSSLKLNCAWDEVIGSARSRDTASTPPRAFDYVRAARNCGRTEVGTRRQCFDAK
jgi:hypothetical protein